MARKSNALAEDDLFVEAPRPSRSARAVARALDEPEESPFLRGQTRIPVRRSPLPPRTARRLWRFLLAGLLFVLAALVCYAVYGYGKHDWHFRIDSGENISLSGNGTVTRAEVMQVMGSDIGRNIFFVPLGERKQQLEQIPWVETATVMRFTPNQLRILIAERTPVAFAQIGSRILLLDATGHLLQQPPGKKAYNFPVVTGMLESEPLSVRAARMKIFAQLVHELDTSGAHYSRDLSEVNLTDPQDVKVTAPSEGGEVLVHLGAENFLERYQTYLGHIAEWRQKFTHIESVDLRVDGEAIVNPGGIGSANPSAAVSAPLSAAVGPPVSPPPAHSTKSPAIAKPPTVVANAAPKLTARPPVRHAAKPSAGHHR